MEVKPGFKQTEVGVIPEDWGVMMLGQLADIRSGGTPSTSQPQFWDGDILWCTPTDITALKGHKYIRDTTRKITLQGLQGSSAEIIPANSLIMTSRATIGESAINQVAISTNQGFKSFVPLEDVEVEFLYYLLQTKKRDFVSRCGGSTFLEISKAQITNFRVQWPPTKAEQETIAEALSDADALIESLEQLLAKKRNLKQGTIQELLRPKSGWIEKKLGNSAILKARIGWQGLTTAEYLDSGDYYLVTGTDFKGGFIDWDNCHFVTESRYKQDKFIQLKEHDVLVTKDGTIGKVALITHLEKPATLNSGVFVIRPTDDAFYPDFFYYLLCSNLFTDFLGQLSAGSTINHLYQKDFVNFIYKTPTTIDEQRAVASILSDMDAEIAALEAKLAKARLVKQGMMQELLTGRIRLMRRVSNVIPFPRKKESTPAATKSHNWQINEAVIIAVLAKHFGTVQWPLARKRCTKLTYLLHRYAEQNAEGYLKKAAGPYNPDTRYKGPEAIAQKNGYVDIQNNSSYEGFVAAGNIAEAESYFEKWYGQDVLKWLVQFRFKKTEELELLTTVDMAIEDLGRTGQKVELNSVKQIIRNHSEWKAKLTREIFSDDNINRALQSCKQLFAKWSSEK